ncbi:MAG TPA: hypothetical protein VIN57_07725, partial [Magnetovibrio sp.]
MRYHCYSKPIRKPIATPVWLGLLAGVSLLAISVATPVRAQGDEFAVDVSDPSVSVDLSVLNDGGLAPQMGTVAPGVIPYSTAPAFGSAKAPGPNAPVSTLYVQPSAGFTLPPQTKPIIAQPAPEPAPEPEMDIAEEAPMPAAPEAPEAEE